jgi:hypothetical protein
MSRNWRDSSYKEGSLRQEIWSFYLNLVLQYVSKTAQRVVKHYNNVNQPMPLIYAKLYM